MPNKQERFEIHFWIILLQCVSTEGIDVNNITFIQPTDTTISDACDHEMGGFNSKSLAWQYKLPPALTRKFSINLLKFIAVVITIHLTIQEADWLQKQLAFTDSSSALGWLYTSNFMTNQSAHDEVGRWLVTSLITNDSALYSQRIRGVHSIIANILSHDWHIPESHIILMFNFLLPEQTPPNLKISSLSSGIISWLHSLPPSLTKTQELPQHPTRRKLGALTDSEDSWDQMESRMFFLKDIGKNNVHTSCPRLQAAADEMNTANQRKQYSPAGPSSPPSWMFVWPFGRTFGQT